jgi:hypothetical protein
MKFLLDVIAYSIFCHFSVKFEAGGDTLTITTDGIATITFSILTHCVMYINVECYLMIWSFSS